MSKSKQTQRLNVAHNYITRARELKYDQTAKHLCLEYAKLLLQSPYVYNYGDFLHVAKILYYELPYICIMKRT